MSEQTPRDRLHAAVQRYSNDIAGEGGPIGVVSSAVVVWEETRFLDDGEVRATVYVERTGDAVTRPSVTFGLVAYAGDDVRRLLTEDDD